MNLKTIKKIVESKSKGPFEVVGVRDLEEKQPCFACGRNGMKHATVLKAADGTEVLVGGTCADFLTGAAPTLSIEEVNEMIKSRKSSKESVTAETEVSGSPDADKPLPEDVA